MTVVEQAMLMSSRAEYHDRAWLAVEMASLISRSRWIELGAVAIHVAVGAAPLQGDLATRVQEERAHASEIEGAMWANLEWVTAKLTAYVGELTADCSDMQALGFKLAGAAARVEPGT